MFEVGRSYRVVTREGDETGYCTHTVLEVSMPIVKFSTPGGYLIINTSAPNFVSAEPNDAQAKDDAAAAAREMVASFKVNLTDRTDDDEDDPHDGSGQGKPKNGY